MLGQNVDLSRSMQLAQAKDFEGLQAETRRLVRQIGVGNIQSMGRAQQNLLEETLGFELGDLMKLGQGETIGAGGTPPVAKDTLSAANKSNELSVEHHKEQMGALKKVTRPKCRNYKKQQRKWEVKMALGDNIGSDNSLNRKANSR